MTFLNPKDAQTVSEQFEEKLKRDVKLIVAVGGDDCMYCNEVQALSEELAGLSDHLSVEVIDIHSADALAYGLDKSPAMAVVAAGTNGAADRDYGIRFYGIPSGYEFMSLLDAIHTVGSDEVNLHQDTRDFLNSLENDVHIQVFVTPTCPHCPRAVMLAHHLAYASPRVRADMVESMEFPELAAQYNVYGVPRTVINDTIHQEGAAPEPMILQKLRQAVTAPAV